ncbi:hypothetical protein LCGC14_1829600 [marine sediment metagenome]|uniref:Uncharacterized protein n=1 Tax=marine sediment metagenome TaxID=412755 RepID=A0A0F9H4M3_9ZZZZ
MTIVIQDMASIIQGPGIVQGIIKDTVIALVNIMIMKDSGYRQFIIGYGDPVVTTNTKDGFREGGKKG